MLLFSNNDIYADLSPMLNLQTTLNNMLVQTMWMDWALWCIIIAFIFGFLYFFMKR